MVRELMVQGRRRRSEAQCPFLSCVKLGLQAGEVRKEQSASFVLNFLISNS